MRERVPDPVAQSFLYYFLQSFSQGQPFHLAIRDARERLQGLEDQYPCASWLPLVYQDPAVKPPVWQDLLTHPSSKPSVPTMAMVSWLVTTMVMGMRLMGWLQPLELQGYDQFIRWRPAAPPDDRILLVTIDEADISQQSPDERRGASLTDARLQSLLTQLHAYQPRVITLDLYRDFAADPSYEELVTSLATSDRLITACSVGAASKGIAPPPEVPSPKRPLRVGFTNTVVDNDGTLRRALLMQTANSEAVCPAGLALGFLSALRYLNDDDITLTWTDGSDPHPKINQVVFAPLKNHSGGYHRLDDRGYQLLLNYGRSRGHGVRTVSLAQLLAGQVDPEWVRDRLVIIGNTDPSFKDFHRTPYTRRHSEQMAGAEIHAHLVRQIFRAVLDSEPLIWTWPQWVDGLWILAWAGVGSSVLWLGAKPWHHGVALGLAVVGLTGICYGIWLVGGWVPWIPGAIALMLTPIAVKALPQLPLAPKNR